ncbi:MAG: protein kinase [Terriglobia bacterium]|nr:protein kinase [Terriglobia bacterium]
MASQGIHPSISAGQKLDHYRIVEEIGVGGMGVVYRAHDEHLDREVAIKVLPEGALANNAARKRFHNEARAVSKLNHPNIATIHAFDSIRDLDYLVMEYVPGEKMRDKVAAGPLSQSEIANLGLQVAEGLVAAHQCGIVHRDLKPENVRLTLDGRLKILDFGLAKLIRPFTDITTTDSNISGVAGTLPYMAPEQLLGKVVDHRTDLFSFGVMLYEMGTGALPFTGSTASAISDAILHRVPTPPVQINPKLSPRLQEIIHKALEKAPELRYQHAADMRADLQRLKRDSQPALPVAAAQSQIFAVDPNVRSRLAMLVPAVVVAVLLAILVVLPMIRTRMSSPPPAHTATDLSPASIAVLPFADLSANKTEEYFSDGLTEELINDLAKIPELRVTARTSSFQFRDKSEDLRTIGEKLNVATVLEGSIRKQGKRVRISVELIKTSDGFHLWSETYDRDLTDIFAVQEGIAQSVAGALKLKLLGRKPALTRAMNPEAYNEYLQGNYFSQRVTKESMEKAVGYYQHAIKLDPDNAPAWAGLARARGVQAGNGLIPLHEGFREARAAAERALALDPSLAEAHAAMGFIERNYDWDWAGADASFQRALALDPGDANAFGDASNMAATLGRWNEAMRLVARRVELDPLRAQARLQLGATAWYAGRLDQAAAALQKALELNPDGQFVHTELSRVYLANSHPQEALAEAERETQPGFRLQALALAYYALGRRQYSDRALAELIEKYQADWALQIAEVYAFRGEVDLAFAWLERAYVQRDAGLSLIKDDPLLKNLDHDPRYAAFLKKMGLA